MFEGGPHAPTLCAACGVALGPDLERRLVSARNSLELVQGDIALQVTAAKHVYFAVRCCCGHENVERPGIGLRSEGRRRNLQMSERCLEGPYLGSSTKLCLGRRHIESRHLTPR